MKKISVVVPVYNVEKYIAKCLDSLVSQTYDNYDVLVVNDGSPANEQTIIDSYVKKYPNIIKSIIKENGGYGSVLELAFNASDAEYVLVCDPDDYLDKDALSSLMSYRDKEDVDLVVSAKNLVYEDNEEIKYDKSFNEDFGIVEDGYKYEKTNEEFNVLYFMEPSPHGKLYKRDIVKDIKFPFKVSYTDSLLYFYTLSKIESVTYCDKPLSFYLINRGGNTRTDQKPKVIDDLLVVFNSLFNQVENKTDIFLYRMFETFYSIYYRVDCINSSKNEKLIKYEEIYKFLERLIPYKEEILKINDIYSNDSNVIRKQKELLLTKEKSKETYDKLVHDRLFGSLKTKIKNLVKNTKLYKNYSEK